MLIFGDRRRAMSQMGLNEGKRHQREQGERYAKPVNARPAHQGDAQATRERCDQTCDRSHTSVGGKGARALLLSVEESHERGRARQGERHADALQDARADKPEITGGDGA